MFDTSIFDRTLMKEAVRIAEQHWSILHTMPEKAFEEKETTDYLRKVCEGYPVNIIDIGMNTGLVCFLDTGADETVALRTDIDAVPTEEGMLHLCGHDAHRSELYTTYVLSEAGVLTPCFSYFSRRKKELMAQGPCSITAYWTRSRSARCIFSEYITDRRRTVEMLSFTRAL